MRVLLIFSISLLCSGLFAQIQIPASSPAATASQMVGMAHVTFEYCRPSMKGRTIFGNIVPYDKVWRTGANKITTISFDKDISINGKKIPSGSYGFCTIPGKEEWTIILNSDNKQWGTYGYDEKKDIARFTAKAEILPTQVEHLTIAFENFTSTKSEVVVSWEKTAVRFTLEQDPKSTVLAEIKEKTSMADVKSDTYFDAAMYYFDNNIDLKKAYEWANKCVEMDRQYWTLGLRARIASKSGMCDQAVKDATATIEMAKKENDEAYVKMGEKVLKDCDK